MSLLKTTGETPVKAFQRYGKDNIMVENTNLIVEPINFYSENVAYVEFFEQKEQVEQEIKNHILEKVSKYINIEKSDTMNPQEYGTHVKYKACLSLLLDSEKKHLNDYIEELDEKNLNNLKEITKIENYNNIKDLENKELVKIVNVLKISILLLVSVMVMMIIMR